jgi:hypothetical protein
MLSSEREREHALCSGGNLADLTTCTHTNTHAVFAYVHLSRRIISDPCRRQEINLGIICAADSTAKHTHAPAF